MATGLEGAATLVSLIGFTVQVFDGCVKGFALLSSARNLGRDADMFRCMLDWEQFRLQKWAETVRLQDKSGVDRNLDWQLILTTLQQIQHLTNDTKALKERYNLVLTNDSLPKTGDLKGDDAEKAPVSPFKKLFGQSDTRTASAAAKVIQSRASPMQKLWWAAVDKASMKRLIDDISHLTQRLYDSLNTSVQAQMKASIDALLQEAIQRSSTRPEFQVLEQLAMQDDGSKPDGTRPESIEDQIKRNSALYPAIRDGNSEKVEFLLDKGGADLHGRDRAGWPPLVRAAECGQLAVAEILLKKGADPVFGTLGRFSGRLPIHFAAEEGHVEVVRLLLKQRDVSPNLTDHQNETALFKAAKNGHEAVVQLLLDQEDVQPDIVTLEGWTALATAVLERHIRIVRALLARRDVNPNIAPYEQTPLWMAAPGEQEVIAELLRRPDIDIDRKNRWGETAFYRAVYWSNLAASQLLLTRGADPNIPDERGRTPLSAASVNENEKAKEMEKVVEFLLRVPSIAINQADDDGQTPLMRAASHGELTSLRLLLAAGADVRATDHGGKTSLHLAAAAGHKIAIKVLLKTQAQIDSQDKKFNTPLAAAAVNGHDAVVRLLLERGADPELADEDEETPYEKARDQHLERVMLVFEEVLRI